MKKKINNAPFLYKFGKTLLSPIYKGYYRPQIIGKENIPTSGPIILAGNHVHLYDQCNTIISTKRFLTYMAKKEYFDSKKTKWFFESVGCIPVDRSTKDKEAVDRALEILNNSGAIGIYPEGTRNALKEEKIKSLYEDYFENISYEDFKNTITSSNPKVSQINFLEHLFLDRKINNDEFSNSIHNPNEYLKKLLNNKVIKQDDYYDSMLLPFKFGAVSMASKTNARIIPVAITGTYKHHGSDLIIRIGKAFRVDNMPLEKANNKLRREIINLMKKSLKES